MKLTQSAREGEDQPTQQWSVEVLYLFFNSNRCMFGLEFRELSMAKRGRRSLSFTENNSLASRALFQEAYSKGAHQPKGLCSNTIP